MTSRGSPQFGMQPSWLTGLAGSYTVIYHYGSTCHSMLLYAIYNRLDISRPYTTRLCPQRNNNNSKTSIMPCTHDRQPIARPDWRAMGWRSWVIQLKRAIHDAIILYVLFQTFFRLSCSHFITIWREYDWLELLRILSCLTHLWPITFSPLSFVTLLRGGVPCGWHVLVHWHLPTPNGLLLFAWFRPG